MPVRSSDAGEKLADAAEFPVCAAIVESLGAYVLSPE
jgi:hypothetical protein